jgi:HEPN domain-containing protein
MGEPPPLDADEYARWREEASQALRGAGLQHDAGLHNWACFLAEQSAQLALKGLLHGLGRGPWGHDLVRLGELAGELVEVPDEVSTAFRRLSRHFIPARYPDAHPSGPPGPHYGVADSQEALDDTAAVLEFIDATWKGMGG